MELDVAPAEFIGRSPEPVTTGASESWGYGGDAATNFDVGRADRIIQERGLRWRYDGALSPVPANTPGGDRGRRVRYSIPERVLTGLAHDPWGYMGVGTSVRIDATGGRWLLEWIDPVVLRQKVEEYDEEVALLFGLEPGAPPNGGVSFPPRAGELVDAILNAAPSDWTMPECGDGDASADMQIHPQSPLTVVADPLNERQRKVVQVYQLSSGGSSGSPLCSGVLVRNRWVLTSAHCVYQSRDIDGDGDSEDYLVTAGSLGVCSRGNLYDDSSCSTVDYYDVYDGEPTGPVDDAVLLRLAESLGEGWFALSQRTASTLSGYDQFHRGYPTYRSWTGSDCSPNGLIGGQTLGYEGWFGTYMFKSSGAMRYTWDATVNLYDVSSGNGMSGGPIFYCPTGDCDGVHYLTGIESRWLSVLGVDAYQASPSSYALREWAIAHFK